ncbi:MAG: GPW/gp25 family protein [Desulfobulbaceae bacterium]|nr:GPW/gp25 family protein [Desulfobulbaceae bacterium]
MAQDQNLLTDIGLDLTHHEFRPVYTLGSKRQSGPGGKGLLVDLTTVGGRDNLAQAIIMRLLTPRGELTPLGHPQYGSRLHELVGEANTETKRNLVRLYILETLQKEPRIEEVKAVTVSHAVQGVYSVGATIQVLPVGETQSVTIGPITLEL